jgi:hypothetical protein
MEGNGVRRDGLTCITTNAVTYGLAGGGLILMGTQGAFV